MVGLPRKKLQVFVSSTFTDLKEERQEAVSAILKAGHIPAGMELFTAGDQSQLDVVKRWIDESDIYMLILGSRYGSIEPLSGLSYTEVEYDYACSKNKPLFSIVLNDAGIDKKLKELGVAAQELSYGDELGTFREKVLSKICSLISDRKEIRGAVYESLIDFSNNENLIGWISGSLFEDTRPLRERINSLEQENERLKSDLDERRAVSLNDGLADEDDNHVFMKLREILRSKVPIPAELTKSGKEEERVIGSVFVLNRSLLVKGWTIAQNPSSINKWFESEILPVLKIHRLISVETTSSGANRYVTTEKGLDFLAWYDAQRLREPADNEEQKEAATPT